MLEGYEYEVIAPVGGKDSFPLGALRASGIASRLSASPRFDAVLISGWEDRSYFEALHACRKLGLPCLVRGDSNALKPRPWWKRWVHHLFLPRFSAYLVVGESNAALYRQHGIPEERLFPSRHFVENDRFASAAEQFRPQRDSIRARWGIGPQQIVFLFCAKFIDRKRPLDFLRGLEEAIVSGRPVHGLIVGDGHLKEACVHYARERGLPATFAGFLNQTEIPQAYVASDCLVLPSDYGETWGLVVNEAMACGVPAVVSDRVGCGPDLIGEGQTGRVFPFGDHLALGRVLSELAGDPPTLVRMGQAARKRIDRYSIDSAAQGILDAVRFVCGSRGVGNGKSILIGRD